MCSVFNVFRLICMIFTEPFGPGISSTLSPLDKTVSIALIDVGVRFTVCLPIQPFPLSVFRIICLFVLLECCKSFWGSIWNCKPVLLELSIIHKPTPPGGFLGPVRLDLFLRPWVYAVRVFGRVGKVLDFLNFLRCPASSCPRIDAMQTIRMNI